ncbi:MAG: hypothetical protein HOL72_00610 [Euryarchaeota archaeon]|jgi:hypothetical protein|nr:hypothetical protein [Euryarchaeota archaeon]MBT5254246.1 hypothetical protein [Euryarchaeota archaeon]
MRIIKPLLALIIVFIFCTLSIVDSVSAHHLEEENYNLYIFQNDGVIFTENLSINGTTTLPPSEATWELWNVGDGLSSWSLELSGSHFTSVEPSAESLWNWTLDITTAGIECTCLLTISVPNGLDPMSNSLIVYLGETGHRPMILDIDYDTTIVIDQPITIEIAYVVPGLNNTGVNVIANICEAPHSVCLEEPNLISLNQSDDDGTVFVTLDHLEMDIDDGIYQFEFVVVDALLLYSNSESLAVVIDTHEPIVNLSGLESIMESEQIIISALIDDGYSGSGEHIVWTIHSPDGKVHSPTTEEKIDDYSLNIVPILSGDWTIELLVRDLGGHFVTTSHAFTVINSPPQAHLTLDGFEVSNGSSLTPANAEDWQLNCSGSSDTSADMETLQYVWLVDGSPIISGTESFTQNDFQIIGQKNMMLIVTDDDGVESIIEFTIYVEEQSDSTSNKSILIGISFIVIIGITLFIVKPISMRYNESKSSKNIPKWEGKKKSE